MNKIVIVCLLFVPLFGDQHWAMKQTLYLPKDYPAIYDIQYKKHTYVLNFRWSLYINKALVMLYQYKNHRYQDMLYKTPPLNGFKKFVAFEDSPNTPYFMICFKDYKAGIATLEVYLYAPKQDVSLKLKESRYMDLDWVKKKLTPLYQRQFEKQNPDRWYDGI